MDRYILGNDSYPFRKSHVFIEPIIPTIVIKNKNAFEITYIDESLHLNGFVITTFTQNLIVTCINLLGEHPNADPNTNVYCLPEYKQQKKLDESFLSLLVKNFKTYYYDSAYFIPDTKLVDYRKLKSIYIQLNGGDN